LKGVPGSRCSKDCRCVPICGDGRGEERGGETD